LGLTGDTAQGLVPPPEELPAPEEEDDPELDPDEEDPELEPAPDELELEPGLPPEDELDEPEELDPGPGPPELDEPDAPELEEVPPPELEVEPEELTPEEPELDVTPLELAAPDPAPELDPSPGDPGSPVSLEAEHPIATSTDPNAQTARIRMMLSTSNPVSTDAELQTRNPPATAHKTMAEPRFPFRQERYRPPARDPEDPLTLRGPSLPTPRLPKQPRRTQ
jgi:hypothetical protein